KLWITETLNKGTSAPPNPIQTIPSTGSAPIGQEFTSKILDAGPTAAWGAISWTDSQPINSMRVVEVRTGNTPTPDKTWSDWTPVANGGGIPTAGRYLIYSTVVLTANPSAPYSSSILPVPFTMAISTIATTKKALAFQQSSPTAPPASSSAPVA